MIGIRFSWASANAVASMIFRSPVQRLLMVEVLVARGVRILFRIGGIDAVDVGRLEHGVAAHLGGAQDRRGIGGEDTDCRCRRRKR